MKTSVEAFTDVANEMEALRFSAEENGATVARQQREMRDLEARNARLQRECTRLARQVGRLTVAASHNEEKMLAVFWSRDDVRRAYANPHAVMVETDERDYKTPHRPVVNDLFNVIADGHQYAFSRWYAGILLGKPVEFFEERES